MYATSMLALNARGVDIHAMSDEDKSKHAEGCFRYVIQWMPPEHPFRREVERYVFEALPIEIKLLHLPSGAW